MLLSFQYLHWELQILTTLKNHGLYFEITNRFQDKCRVYVSLSDRVEEESKLALSRELVN